MNIPHKRLRKFIATILLLLSALAFTSPVTADTVMVPIKLDFPLLRQLMLNQLFNSPEGSAEILHDPAGCNKIFLSDPQLQEQQQKLEVRTHVKAAIATDIFGVCTSLFDWEGDARFLAEPVIQSGARSVRLNILSTQLYTPQGQLISSGQIWELAHSQLQSLLHRYEIDLAPAIDELNKLLPHILDRRSAQQLKKITDSLGLAAITVAPEGIEVDISLQIDRLPPDSQPEAVYSAQELQQLEAKWRMMDAMITFAVKQYAAATHLQEAREALLEILLDARYQLRDALAMPANRADDPVRHWFIDSWQRLGPVLRQISLETPGQEPMLLVSLLTATNVLEALDKLGPWIGLDISTDGLRRMGRLLIDRPGIDPLRYDEAVDPELRRLFKLPESPELSEPSGFNFNLWPIGNAWAASATDRLNRWVPEKSELPEYLPLIRELLIDSARKISEAESLPAANARLHRHLVLTTAWQESCWRQFVIEKGKVVPLRSDSGDVGLMQVNERVWRGFYDIQKLRWDIRYNAEAGSEILRQYLVNYALKNGEHKRTGGEDNLARATYSAYNNGPGQIARYRNPKTTGLPKKIDAAFWSKYQLVKQGKEFEVAECLGVDAASITPVAKKSLAKRIKQKTKPAQTVATSRQNRKIDRLSAKSSPPAKLSALSQHSKPTTKPMPTQGPVTAASKNLGKSWILAQPKRHFTLQLGVFSTTRAARKYMTENPLPGIVALAPLGKDKQGQFVVLSGSFPTRAEADQAKARYKRLKPWIRPFKDIHSALK
jgi:soluble lytic murein transglycosylase-like protein